MLRSALVSCLVLTLCGGACGSEDVRVGGGGASIATVFKPLKPHFEKTTGITLVLAQSTPKNGLIDLINGSVDLATSAVPLDAMIKGAEKEGVQIAPDRLQVTVIAQNRTVLFVHASNQVQTLSKDQIKGIFTGAITNWKEVGGGDLPILVVWGKLTPGQNAQFVKTVLDGASVLQDVVETTDYGGIKNTVAATPEAIGIDPFAMLDDTVRNIPTVPELAGDIIAVTLKEKSSANTRKLIAYILGAGSQYIIKK